MAQSATVKEMVGSNSLPPLHDHFGHRAHVPHVVQEREAPPDVDVHLGNGMLDHVLRIGPVAPEVRLADQGLLQHVRHQLAQDAALLEGALPAGS